VLLQGKRGALLRGTLLGGAWNIVTCYRGVGEHCFIQECCCEQSEVVRKTTLQEEQKKTSPRTMLQKERC